LRNRINLKINVTTIEYSLFVIWVTKNGMWVGSVSRYQAPKPGFRLGGDAPGSWLVSVIYPNKANGSRCDL